VAGVYVLHLSGQLIRTTAEHPFYASTAPPSVFGFVPAAKHAWSIRLAPTPAWMPSNTAPTESPLSHFCPMVCTDRATRGSRTGRMGRAGPARRSRDPPYANPISEQPCLDPPCAILRLASRSSARSIRFSFHQASSPLSPGSASGSGESAVGGSRRNP